MGELDRLSARELIQRALTRHTLSPASASALQETQIARQIQQALERSYTVERARKLLLITMMPDDSGSMQARMQGSAITKQDSVIEGHNELLEAMRDGGHGKRTMLQTRYGAPRRGT